VAQAKAAAGDRGVYMLGAYTAPSSLALFVAAAALSLALPRSAPGEREIAEI
jgi:hypothetical protein